MKTITGYCTLQIVVPLGQSAGTVFIYEPFLIFNYLLPQDMLVKSLRVLRQSPKGSTELNLAQVNVLLLAWFLVCQPIEMHKHTSLILRSWGLG
jgi:hypothetical protein